jgi:membrane-bound serine protease (ClpP class)
MVNFMRIYHDNNSIQTMKRFLFLLLFVMPMVAFAQKTKVMIMEIRDEIDPRMNRYVELALNHAEKTKADIVLIDMDTYGGALTDAKEIVDKIMHFKKPVWVYINSDAASAGALISIACDSIYMAPGGNIGAATVVDQTGQQAPDKYQSYMRSIMRSTAEENGRNPRIAEGMVDASFAIDSVKKAGQVITFSTSEAIKNGFCEAKVESIDEILKRNSITDYEVERYELSWAEKVIAIFINPFISGILILIILGGIYYEMQHPGIGFALFASITALLLYLIPYYLNGLAENWEIIALFAGLILIGVEIFVLPGFGVAGISGITLTVGSLILIMVNNDFFNFDFVPANDLGWAVAATLGGMVGSVGLLFALGSQIKKTGLFKRVALTDTQEGFKASVNEPMEGKRGVAHTILRPSGKVLIDGQLYDAYTRGEYIEKGEEIEVVGEETTSLRVKSLEL